MGVEKVAHSGLICIVCAVQSDEYEKSIQNSKQFNFMAELLRHHYGLLLTGIINHSIRFNGNFPASIHLTCNGRITPLGYCSLPSLSNKPD